MDSAFAPEEEAFRREVQQYLKQILPPDWEGLDDEYIPESNFEITRSLVKELADKGWLTISWPREYGGVAARGSLKTRSNRYHDDRKGVYRFGCCRRQGVLQLQEHQSS